MAAAVRSTFQAMARQPAVVALAALPNGLIALALGVRCWALANPALPGTMAHPSPVPTVIGWVLFGCIVAKYGLLLPLALHRLSVAGAAPTRAGNWPGRLLGSLLLTGLVVVPLLLVGIFSLGIGVAVEYASGEAAGLWATPAVPLLLVQSVISLLLLTATNAALLPLLPQLSSQYFLPALGTTLSSQGRRGFLRRWGVVLVVTGLSLAVMALSASVLSTAWGAPRSLLGLLGALSQWVNGPSFAALLPALGMGECFLLFYRFAACPADAPAKRTTTPPLLMEDRLPS